MGLQRGVIDVGPDWSFSRVQTWFLGCFGVDHHNLGSVKERLGLGVADGCMMGMILPGLGCLMQAGSAFVWYGDSSVVDGLPFYNPLTFGLKYPEKRRKDSILCNLS